MWATHGSWKALTGFLLCAMFRGSGRGRRSSGGKRVSQGSDGGHSGGDDVPVKLEEEHTGRGLGGAVELSVVLSCVHCGVDGRCEDERDAIWAVAGA